MRQAASLQREISRTREMRTENVLTRTNGSVDGFLHYMREDEVRYSIHFETKATIGC